MKNHRKCFKKVFKIPFEYYIIMHTFNTNSSKIFLNEFYLTIPSPIQTIRANILKILIFFHPIFKTLSSFQWVLYDTVPFSNKSVIKFYRQVHAYFNYLISSELLSFKHIYRIIFMYSLAGACPHIIFLEKENIVCTLNEIISR